MDGHEKTTKRSQRRPDRQLYVPRHRKKEPEAPCTIKKNPEYQNRTLSEDKSDNKNYICSEIHEVQEKLRGRFTEIGVDNEVLDLKSNQAAETKDVVECSAEEKCEDVVENSSPKQGSSFEGLGRNVDEICREGKARNQDLESGNSLICTSSRESLSYVKTVNKGENVQPEKNVDASQSATAFEGSQTAMDFEASYPSKYINDARSTTVVKGFKATVDVEFSESPTDLDSAGSSAVLEGSGTTTDVASAPLVKGIDCVSSAKIFEAAETTMDVDVSESAKDFDDARSSTALEGSDRTTVVASAPPVKGIDCVSSEKIFEAAETTMDVEVGESLKDFDGARSSTALEGSDTTTVVASAPPVKGIDCVSSGKIFEAAETTMDVEVSESAKDFDGARSAVFEGSSTTTNVASASPDQNQDTNQNQDANFDNGAMLLKSDGKTNDELDQNCSETILPPSNSQIAVNKSCKPEGENIPDSKLTKDFNVCEQQRQWNNMRGSESNSECIRVSELSAGNNIMHSKNMSPSLGQRAFDELSLGLAKNVICRALELPKSKKGCTKSRQMDVEIARNDSGESSNIVESLRDNDRVDSFVSHSNASSANEQRKATSDKHDAAVDSGTAGKSLEVCEDLNLENNIGKKIASSSSGNKAIATETQERMPESNETPNSGDKKKWKSRKMKLQKKGKNESDNKKSSNLRNKGIRDANDCSDGKSISKENREHNTNGSEDDWDVKWNESGECLNEEALSELKKLTEIDKPVLFYAEQPEKEIDYLSYEPRPIDNSEFDHLVEIYDFSADLKTTDISIVLKTSGSKDFDITWVDDTHAIAVFGSAFAAHQATKISSLTLKARPLSEGTKKSKLKARSIREMLLPYKPRPETTASVARNLVTSALGLRSNISKEQRSAERQKIADARETKRLHEKIKKETWGD